jgi:nucleotide-binding universal stress UspA family protein
MYKHILIPTDGSERSEKAIAHGAALAATLNAKLTILTVTAPFHSIGEGPKPVVDIPGSDAFVQKYLYGEADGFLAVGENIAAEQGVTCDTIHLEHEHPYAAIIETVQTRECDLIVMASHGRRGIAALILGSETMKVLTHGSTPVLVHRS